MRKFSLVIITRNEAENIGRCLESVRGLTDDIVIMDSGSMDETEKICKSYNARFFNHKFIDFSQQKNLANEMAKHDWILSLDADEAFDEDLKVAFLDTLSGSDTSCMSFNRLTYYCGHWVKHCGWYPDRKLRFFNRKFAKWEGSIHEELVFSKETEITHLNGHLLHYSYYTTDEHRSQAERFTQMKSERMRILGKSDSALKSALSGIWKFISIYFIKLGLLDGKSGWKIAMISAKAAFKRYRLRKQ